MPKAKKAAIYCRVSTLHQIDKDSLPMQKIDMINYAKYILSIEDYEVFEDAGYSGKNTDRPAFQDMMARVSQGEFTHILVWKIDRISRNLLDFATMYEKCKKLGVTFVSKNEQFDTSTAMGEAMLKIILVFAELERNMTSERVSATMLARANSGQWNGGRIPFGYSFDKESKTFSIREDEAAVVRKIYDSYENTHSLVQTTCQINTAGITSRRGFAWTPTSVQIILRNPFYIGSLRYNYRDESEKTFSFKDKTDWILIENHHIPMIDKSQFERCAYWLGKNHRGKGIIHRQRKNIHIFAGLLYCGYCGSLMQSTVARLQPDGYRPSIYLCGAQRINHTCKNKYARDTIVGPFLFAYIRNMLQIRKDFQPTCTKKEMEKRLLSGDEFTEVKGISSAALSSLRCTLISNTTGEFVYTVKNTASKTLPEAIKHGQKKSELNAAMDKAQRALKRLKDLYLFSDSAMSQQEYLIKRDELTKEVDICRHNIRALEKDSIFMTNLSDERFIEQASSFLFQKSFTKTSALPFKELVMAIGAAPLKEFINSIVDSILVKDGHVIEITFRNGIAHQFIYN